MSEGNQGGLFKKITDKLPGRGKEDNAVYKRASQTVFLFANNPQNAIATYHAGEASNPHEFDIRQHSPGTILRTRAESHGMKIYDWYILEYAGDDPNSFVVYRIEASQQRPAKWDSQLKDILELSPDWKLTKLSPGNHTFAVSEAVKVLHGQKPGRGGTIEQIDKMTAGNQRKKSSPIPNKLQRIALHPDPVRV